MNLILWGLFPYKQLQWRPVIRTFFSTPDDVLSFVISNFSIYRLT